jgi:hypothetical protein
MQSVAQEIPAFADYPGQYAALIDSLHTLMLTDAVYLSSRLSVTASLGIGAEREV